MTFEELTDPPAIRFWPEVKGRDGCRTPMVWEADAPHAGFTTGTPWLPVKEPQAARAVDRQVARNDSLLHHYKEVIAYRKAQPCLTLGKTQFIDLPEPVLAFTRSHEGQHLTCLFNLSATPQEVTLGGAADLDGPVKAELSGETLTLPANGWAYLTHADALNPTMG